MAGCGPWGTQHLRVLGRLPDVDTVAIDRRLDCALEAGARFGSIGAATSAEDCLDRLDGLVVATPADSHFGLGMAAIAARRPVLIEKPFALGAGCARRLAIEAEAGDVVVRVGHTYMHSSAVQFLAHMVADGTIGPVRSARSVRTNVASVRADADVLWDLAPHDLSILRRILGRGPGTVTADASRWDGARPSEVRLDLTYGDVDVTVELSWVAGTRRRQLVVEGDPVSAFYDLDRRTDPVRLVPARPSSLPVVGRDDPGAEPLLRQAAAFVQAVRGEATVPVEGTDAWAGVAVADVVEAAWRSLDSGACCPVGDVAVPPTTLGMPC